MPRSANDEVFNHYRSKAIEYDSLSKESFRLSQQAYQRGDKSGAMELSKHGKSYKMLKNQENKNAADKIFAHHNGSRPLKEIDLHGLFVGEAIAKLEERIKLAKLNNLSNLMIIVGRGNHSEGEAKLRPAVIRFAKRNNISYRLNLENKGRVYINFDSSERSPTQRTNINDHTVDINNDDDYDDHDQHNIDPVTHGICGSSFKILLFVLTIVFMILMTMKLLPI